MKNTQLSRQFLGTIGNKVSDFGSKQERAFQKAHLKAYLKGSKYFTYGFTDDAMGGRIPATHVVQQKYSTRELKSKN